MPDDVWDTLTVPMLVSLNAYWKKHPPMHLLLAAYVGYKPEEIKDGNEFGSALGGMSGVQFVKS